MWADAQRDGRPAEYRWRPLFNAAKLGPHSSFFLICYWFHIPVNKGYICKTRMWADAQRDGRPAEYRWRPLFNAAKLG